MGEAWEVNIEKSKVARPTQIKYLGFGFYNKQGTWRPKPHIKSVQKFVRKIKSLTRRNHSISLTERIKMLNAVIRGWINYFKIADMKKTISKIAQHLRRRIREIIWKQWKNCITRYKALIKLGINELSARENAGSSKKYWRLSKNPTIHSAISNKRLEQRGLIPVETYYDKVHNYT